MKALHFVLIISFVLLSGCSKPAVETPDKVTPIPTNISKSTGNSLITPEPTSFVLSLPTYKIESVGFGSLRSASIDFWQENENIYLTTDGSIPDENSEMLSKSLPDIPMPNNSILRLIKIDDKGRKSKVERIEFN